LAAELADTKFAHVPPNLISATGPSRELSSGETELSI
jgi:hypothetical protein